MQSERITLSPLQSERLERLEARYPGAYVDVVGQDALSCALEVEVSLAGQDVFLTISASGRCVEA